MAGNSRTLIDLHVLKKENPVGAEGGRNGIYSLCDNMFKFWYKFIPENITNIEAGTGKIVIDKKVKPHLTDYLGRIFEDICIHYMIRRNKILSLPIMFDCIGRWWRTILLKEDKRNWMYWQFQEMLQFLEWNLKGACFFMGKDLIRKNAGLGHKGLHAGRHTFASLLFKLGADVKTVGDLMGIQMLGLLIILIILIYM